MAPGKSASVDIRGFGETAPLNTLVLVDGRRVNEIDLSGVDWTQIPLDQIERIEIVRGAGSVLYGDNALEAWSTLSPRDLRNLSHSRQEWPWGVTTTTTRPDP